MRSPDLATSGFCSFFLPPYRVVTSRYCTCDNSVFFVSVRTEGVRVARGLETREISETQLRRKVVLVSFYFVISVL